MTHEEMKADIARRRELLVAGWILTTLGQQFAIAAALCWAFRLGMTRWSGHSDFTPGCGRCAP